MANFNINKVILGGRLTADPELKQTNSGKPVCSFTLAVNRRFSRNNEADFITCVAWDKTAEFVNTYFKKGSSLCVVGAVQTRSWEQDGQKRYATEVQVDEALFVDGKNDAQQAETGADAQAYIPDAYKAPTGSFSPMDEDFLPF